MEDEIDALDRFDEAAAMVRNALAHKLALQEHTWDQPAQRDFRKAVADLEEIVRKIDESGPA